MNFPKTKEGFYFFVNNKEIGNVMKSQKCDNVIFLEELEKEDIQGFLDTGLGGFFLIYNNGNKYDDIYELLRDEYKAPVIRRTFSNYCVEDDELLEKCIDFIKDKKTIKMLKDNTDMEEIKIHVNYKGRCGNCHSKLNKGDKYCKDCGTKVGEGEFKPYVNRVYCVYGPMIANKYTCPKCKYGWSECNPGGRGDTYCPKCGSKIDESIELVSDNGPFIVEDKDSIKELMKKLEEKAKEIIR